MLLACRCTRAGMPAASTFGARLMHGPFLSAESLADALYWHAFTRGCAGVAAGARRALVAAAGPSGFASDHGRARPDPLLDRQSDRYYFAITAAGSRRLRAALQMRLDMLGLPFSLKWVREQAAHARLDSMVLYCPRRCRGLVALDLPRIAGRLDPGMLRPEVPIFTLPLLPGVAMAEGLADGSSFGMDRCRRVAEALWLAQAAGIRDRDARIGHVARHFRQHGIPVGQPWTGSPAGTRRAAA